MFKWCATTNIALLRSGKSVKAKVHSWHEKVRTGVTDILLRGKLSWHSVNIHNSNNFCNTFARKCSSFIFKQSRKMDSVGRWDLLEQKANHQRWNNPSLVPWVMRCQGDCAGVNFILVTRCATSQGFQNFQLANNPICVETNYKLSRFSFCNKVKNATNLQILGHLKFHLLECVQREL